MPTSLPVPSKGALRHLRRLALGTSCTLAFSAGLLTEDRRRRIHAAREVHGNAQKLKTSRKYHSTGTATLESFQEQALYLNEDALWLPSNVAKTREINFSPASHSKARSYATPPPIPPPATNISSRLDLLPLETTKSPAGRKNVSIAQSINGIPSSQPRKQAAPKQQLHNRQHKLAVDVKRLMGHIGNLPDFDAAASRFLEAFEEGLEVGEGGLLPILLDTALKLSNTAFQHLKLDIAEQVLLVVSRHGPIGEDLFEQFRPADVIERMVGHYSHTTQKVSMTEGQLEAASTIYLTTFKAKPKKVYIGKMQDLGEVLAAQTCDAGMYELTMKLCSRIESQRGHGIPRAVNHLIVAAHAKRQNHQIYRYFTKLYTATSPSQREFYQIVYVVLDSVLEQRCDIKKAELVLLEASKMARNNGLLLSSTWLLRVLGQEWRTSRNITTTREMFDRMISYVPLTSHPQAVYGAIIQFCVEAGEESAAMSYYDQLTQHYHDAEKDIRIQGHIALAKAMRKDWVGVEESLGKLSLPRLADQDDYNAIFTPILKLYATSHDTRETEGFLHKFVEKCHLQITEYIFNLMLGVYCKARELDSIVRWIDYATSFGCQINVGTFNTLLSNCYRIWKFSFMEVLELYHQVCSRDLPRIVSLTNGASLSTLRTIARSSARTSEEARRNLSHIKNLDDRSSATDPHDIYLNMLDAYTGRRLSDVVHTYINAQTEDIIVGDKHLSLAVKASLEMHGDLDEASLLISRAARDGLDVSSAVSHLILRRIEIMDNGVASPNEIVNMVEKTIADLESRKVRVSPLIITSTLSMLVRRGWFEAALELWDAVSCRYKQSTSTVDLVTLTVLLQAYIGLQQHIGVDWVIKVLTKNKLVPDKKFLLLLKNTRRQMYKNMRLKPISGDAGRDFLASIERAIEKVVNMRRVAVLERDQVRSQTLRIMESAILEDRARRKYRAVSVPLGHDTEDIGQLSVSNKEFALTESLIEDDLESLGTEESLPSGNLVFAKAVNV